MAVSSDDRKGTTGGRDFVGDTHAMLYLGLQILTKVEK
jgi:hypothetical protein